MSKTNNLKIYSTEEVKTGEYWIDGKPIYKKTFRLDITKTGEAIQNPLNIDNLEKAWIDQGSSYYAYKNNDILSTFPLNFISGSNSIKCYIVGEQISITTTAWTNGTAYVVVNYTKTTD